MKTESMKKNVEELKKILVAVATGKIVVSDGFIASVGRLEYADFEQLRMTVVSNPALTLHIPQCLHACRSLDEFWDFIKSRFSTYEERKTYIRQEFHPMLQFLEQAEVQCDGAFPSDQIVSTSVATIDALKDNWSKALERRTAEPEGAITMARTLLESVCKHILDELQVQYDANIELPKLYKETAKNLNLSPSQHTEQVFKQILGGCSGIVEGLGSLRNQLGDAHGKGTVGAKPALRHAELAVNLAGSLTAYLLATWKSREANGGEQ